MVGVDSGAARVSGVSGVEDLLSLRSGAVDGVKWIELLLGKGGTGSVFLDDAPKEKREGRFSAVDRVDKVLLAVSLSGEGDADDLDRRVYMEERVRSGIGCLLVRKILDGVIVLSACDGSFCCCCDGDGSITGDTLESRMNKPV